MNLPEIKLFRVLKRRFEPELSQDCLNLTMNFKIIVGIVTGHYRMNCHLEKLGTSTETAHFPEIMGSALLRR